MATTAAERLTKLVEHFNTNIKAFAAMCGYDRPQAFYDVQKGKTRNISPTMCDKIIEKFPSVSRVWLMTGEGSMQAEAPKAEAPDLAHRVPLVRTTALAGPISAYYEDGEDLRECERVVDPSMSADLAVPISGDSMEPMFPNGSIAFIARINEASFIPWGHPLVLETENGVFIKNILPDEADSAYIWAKSINPKYPPMHIPKSAIYRMYRIITVSLNFVTM